MGSKAHLALRNARSKRQFSPCSHCGKRTGLCCRTLCRTCWNDPVIRDSVPRHAERKQACSTCRHCQRRSGNYSRGLCYACFNTEAVRNLYPPLRAGGAGGSRRGLGLANHSPTTLGEPTDIPPGPDKVAVLASRAAAGLALWHPQDAQHEE